MDKEKAPGREQITIRLPGELKEELQKVARRKCLPSSQIVIFEKVRAEAQKKGMTLNSLMIEIIRKYVEAMESGATRP